MRRIGVSAESRLKKTPETPKRVVFLGTQRGDSVMRTPYSFNRHRSPASPARTERLLHRGLLIAGLLLACALLPFSAAATPSSDFSYFDASANVLDFDEIAMTQSTVITNQYAALGVVFGANVWFENHRSNLGWDTHNIANFLTGTSTANTVVDIAFSTNVTGAAFEWASNNGSGFRFEAILDGSVVEQFDHQQTGCCAAQVLGFENVEFDTLRVTHRNGGDFFIADRLTWQPVPEPSTALLIGLGLAGLGFSRRRAA